MTKIVKIMKVYNVKSLLLVCKEQGMTPTKGGKMKCNIDRRERKKGRMENLGNNKREELNKIKY